MGITINNQAGTPFVSVSALAQWLGEPLEVVETKLRVSDVATKVEAGATWAPTSNPSVGAMMAEAGVDEMRLFTQSGAVAQLDMGTSQARAAAAALPARFMNEFMQPLHTEAELRAPISATARPSRPSAAPAAAARDVLERPLPRPSRPVRPALGATPRAARAPRPAPVATPLMSPATRAAIAAVGHGTVRVGRVALPYAIGAVPTMYVVPRLASAAGDLLDPQEDQRSRRAGALLAGSVVGVGSGLAVAKAIAPDAPNIAKVARGAALGSAMLGALALNGLHAVSDTMEGH